MTNRAVLAGCGAVARGWAKARREQPDLVGRAPLVGLVGIDTKPAEVLGDSFGLHNVTIGIDLSAQVEIAI